MLDEPFGGARRVHARGIVVRDPRPARRAGFTVILVTHDLREAAFLADRIFCMSARPGPHHRRARGRPAAPARPRDHLFTPAFTDIVHELRATSPRREEHDMTAATRRSRALALAPWLFTLGFFVLWEIACRASQVSSFMLPAAEHHPRGDLGVPRPARLPRATHALDDARRLRARGRLRPPRSAWRSAPRGSSMPAPTRCSSASTRSRRSRWCRSWCSGSASAGCRRC